MSNAKTAPFILALKKPVSQPNNADIVTQTEDQLEKALTEELGAVGIGYKSYVARLSQTSTTAPTITLISNNTGKTVTAGYVGVGIYTLDALVTTALKPKVAVFTQNGGSAAAFVTAEVNATDQIEIRTFNTSFAAANALLDDCCIEVRIYA